MSEHPTAAREEPGAACTWFLCLNSCLGRIWGWLRMLNGHHEHLWCCCPAWWHRSFMQKIEGEKKRGETTPGSRISLACVFQGRHHPCKWVNPMGVPAGHARSQHQGGEPAEVRAGSWWPVHGGSMFPPIQKGEAAPGQGYSWFPVTWASGAAAHDRKCSPCASDHCSAGYVDFCIKLEDN